MPYFHAAVEADFCGKVDQVQLVEPPSDEMIQHLMRPDNSRMLSSVSLSLHARPEILNQTFLDLRYIVHAIQPFSKLCSS